MSSFDSSADSVIVSVRFALCCLTNVSTWVMSRHCLQSGTVMSVRLIFGSGGCSTGVSALDML